MARTGRRMKISVKCMASRPLSVDRDVGLASAVGRTELSIMTADPLCSLIWPAVTTVVAVA